MIDLDFRIDDVIAEPYAAVPQLTARLQISERSGEQVHALALRCQVRIEPQRRAYDGTRLPDSPTNSDRGSDGLRPSNRSSGCTARLWSKASARRHSLIFRCR